MTATSAPHRPSAPKRAVRALLSHPTLNRWLRPVVRPAVRHLSLQTLARFPVVGVVDVEFPGVPKPTRFANDGTDPVSALCYWRGGDGWEPETVSVYIGLLRPSSVVLDVGAHTGLYSVIAGVFDPTVQVHAFEPAPLVATKLRENVQLNGLSNVIVHECAVSDGAGRATLFVPREGVPVMSSLVEGWRPDSDPVQVDTVSLDDFARSDLATGSRVGVLKVDAEGVELSVLRGAAALLADHRPMIICEVLDNSGDVAEVDALLAANRYRIFALTDAGPEPRDKLVGGGVQRANNLFVPEERVPELAGLTSGGSGR